MSVTSPTVLVLGAGASLSYGFPLGVDLRDAVCVGLASGDCRRLLLDIGHSQRKIDGLLEGLQHSAFRSVDLFLEHNPEFLLLGKRAIAAVLLPCEKASRLFPPGAPSGSHWYEYLLGQLEPGTSGWEANRLSVVTYNYDRSLEHYLTRVIAQRARCTIDEAVTARKHIPIVHVHGALGQYSMSAFSGITFGSDLTPHTVANAADAIKVVSELDDTTSGFSRAAELLGVAERIYFLGFGFSQVNVSRLKVFSEHPWRGGTPPLIAGTRMGMADREWESAKGQFGPHWNGPAVESDPLGFLRAYADLT